MRLMLGIASLGLVACNAAMPVRDAPDPASFASASQCEFDNAVVLQRTPPAYPRSALASGQSGWVLLQFDVSAGTPINITVRDSSPAGIFEDAAMDSLKKSAYSGNVNGTGCFELMSFELR